MELKDIESGELLISDQSFEWKADKTGLPKMWMTAYKEQDGTYTFKLDKTIARLVTVSETEDELVLHLEPK